jgi:hypothetical protein
MGVFSGPVKAYDVSGFPARRNVGVEFFSERDSHPGDIVLIYTGYQPPTNDEEYPSTVTLTREAAGTPPCSICESGQTRS